MIKRGKLGTRRGVAEWKNLQTAGDCKRLFAWLIHSIRDGTIDSREAVIMAPIGGYLLKAVETHDVEERLARLEHQGQRGPQQPLTSLKEYEEVEDD